jgi:hypothetical protein
MTYQGLPVFDLTIEEDNIFSNVSLVDFPAIQRDFIKFSEDTEIKFAVDEEKHIVNGPVLIPGQMIYRRQGDREYYVRFNEKAIEEMALRFFKDHSNTNGNVMHQIEVEGITYFESYILNKERNIAPVEFNDLPNGTWIMSAKIENEELWKLVKDGTIRGFSIDAVLTSTPAKDEIDTIDDLIDYIKSI